MRVIRSMVALLLANLTYPGVLSHAAHDSHRRLGKDMPRKDVSLFVGVQTGFGYRHRRDKLRDMWFPATSEALQRLEGEQSIAMRFVIGNIDDNDKMRELKEEVEAYGGFLRIPHQEGYQTLSRKTHMFFKTVLQSYNPQYVLKADDDVYLQMDRLKFLVPQYQAMQKDYIGCFMANSPVIHPDNEKYPQWVEPQHSLLGDHYVSYARGSAYMLSKRALGWISSLPPRSLRYFRNEDVTVGMWMATFNATHYEDRRLCSYECTPTSVLLYQHNLCTSCDPTGFLQQAHEDERCHAPPALEEGSGEGADMVLKTEQPNIVFTQLNEEVNVIPGSRR